MYTFAPGCIPTQKPKKPSEHPEEESTRRECYCCGEGPPGAEELSSEEYQYGRYLIENITVTHPPLLKVYYWECLNIDGLNEALSTNDQEINHTFTLFPRLLHSRPLKIVFWIRNKDRALVLKSKRIKNCQCTHQQTRVGFNQYRYLYHCPHRRLVHVAQEEIHMEPNELVALSMTFYYFYAGKNTVSYKIMSDDGRVINLNILFDVDCFFVPEKCIINKMLVPVNIEAMQRFVQPIWVLNSTMCHLTFIFKANSRGTYLVNTNLTVPCQSIWPLMMEYRASDCTNDIELEMNFESISSMVPLKAEGVCGNFRFSYTCPVLDIDCNDFLYTIYPNRLEIFTCKNTTRTAIISVTNHSQECVEFRFQNYVINDHFVITFEPVSFRLKGHHSKLVFVAVRTFDKCLYFHRIPLIMEVHRVLDRATRIARELLIEVESIDDPKWGQDSYKEHVYMHMDIMIELPEVIRSFGPVCESVPCDQMSSFINMKNWYIPPPPATRSTIFERLFFDYLAESDFLKDKCCDETYLQMSYDQVMRKAIYGEKEGSVASVSDGEKLTKLHIYKSISKIIWNSCIELSKTWRFVPEEQLPCQYE